MRTPHLLLLVLLLRPVPAHAQEAPSPWAKDPPSGPDVILPIHKGSPSPLDGVVFDLETAKRWARDKERLQSELRTQDRLYKDLLAVELKRVRETQQLALEVKNRELLQALQRSSELEKKLAEPPPFYRSPWFGGAVGAVLVASVLGGALLLAR